MKLYIKQKVLTLTDKYNVYDQAGELFYKVNSEPFAWGARLHLMDTQERELYLIHRKVTMLLGKYEIFQGDHLCAEIQQQFRMFGAKLDIVSEHGDYSIDGDLFCYEFKITQNDRVLGTVSKKYMSWCDSYELDIYNAEDAPFFCALVIAIDNCIHNR